jgi:hypothetical protein
MAEQNRENPIARVIGVTLDVNDIDREIEFWAAVLSDQPKIKRGAPGWAGFEVTPGFFIDLQQVPEEKIIKNRFHFDLHIVDGERGIERLIQLGASDLRHIESPHGAEWHIMADPEGNEFCAVTRRHPDTE